MCTGEEQEGKKMEGYLQTLTSYEKVLFSRSHSLTFPILLGVCVCVCVKPAEGCYLYANVVLFYGKGAG